MPLPAVAAEDEVSAVEDEAPNVALASLDADTPALAVDEDAAPLAEEAWLLPAALLDAEGGGSRLLVCPPSDDVVLLDVWFDEVLPPELLEPPAVPSEPLQCVHATTTDNTNPAAPLRKPMCLLLTATWRQKWPKNSQDASIMQGHGHAASSAPKLRYPISM